MTTTDKCVRRQGSNHLSGYRNDGCRCVDCTRANTEAVQEWRWKTGKTKRRLTRIQRDE